MKDIKGVNMQEKIGKILLAVFLFICLAILTYLTVFHFLYSYINTFEAYDIENPSLIKDSIIENLLCIASGVLVSFGLFKFCKDRTVLCNIFIYVLASISMVVSITWVLKSGIIPNYDPASICAAAVAFNKGDYSLLEKGQYVAIWPNQLGIISILRFVFLLCGENNYLAFQILNAVSVFFIILFVSKITQALTGDNGAVILSLVL